MYRNIAEVQVWRLGQDQSRGSTRGSMRRPACHNDLPCGTSWLNAGLVLQTRRHSILPSESCARSNCGSVAHQLGN